MNVVALFVILVSITPVYFAQKLAGDTGVPGHTVQAATPSEDDGAP